MEKRWEIAAVDKAKVEALHQSLKINPILCSLLINRGINTFTEAKGFFRPNLEDLHDPFLMKDMEKAVARVQEAFAKNQKILLSGRLFIKPPFG